MPQEPLKATDSQLWTKEANIIFLVGCPRSGTTWLQNMLAMHPSVATGPETHFFSMARRFDVNLQEDPPRPAGIRQYMPAEEFYEVIVDVFHRIISKVPTPDSSSPTFVEKSPQHALFLPLIARCLPDSRIVHLIRDGRHVVASLLRASRTWGKGKFPSYPSTAAELWKTSVLSARMAPELFKNSDPYYELRYEDLRAHPQDSLEQLFDWIGLDQPRDLPAIVKESSLARTKSRQGFAAISVPSDTNANVAPEPDGFFGAGKVADGEFELTRMEEYACYQVFGPLLKDVGYCQQVPAIPWWAKVANSWTLRQLLERWHN